MIIEKLQSWAQIYLKFHDTNLRKNKRIPKQRIPGFQDDEFLYADDTMLITQTATAMEQLLHLVQEEGSKIHLSLTKKNVTSSKLPLFLPFNF